VNKLRNLLRPKMVLSGLFAAVVLAVGIGMVQRPAQAAVDCDNNAVIKCGYTDLNDLVNKAAANPYGDLPQLYNHWGGNWQGYMPYFKDRAQHVTVYKSSGEIKLDDGTVVATNTQSLGRQPITGNNHNLTIGSKTYYYGPVQGNFNPASLDGYAMFNDDDHSMVLTILKACGNPTWGTSPGYKCNMLNQTKVNDTTYSYVATPYVKDGASVSRIVYDFGDGKSQTITSNFGQSVQHVYTPGNYTARATVYFSVNGKEQSDTRADCTKPVSVPKPKPIFACTGLIAKQVANSRTKFTFSASAHVENGAALQSATFKFDDGTSTTVTASGTVANTTHEYTSDGNHTTSVDLTFNAGTDAGNVHCIAKTTTVPPTCKDTPNKPECQTCQNTPSKPGCQTCQNTPSLPECQPPAKTCADTPEAAECKVLPSTGPEEFVGTALGLSSLTGAGVYYRASRRNLLGRLIKKS
jgi:hypothetical protein